MHSNFRFLAEHSPLLAQLGATRKSSTPSTPPAACPSCACWPRRQPGDRLTDWPAPGASHPGRAAARRGSAYRARPPGAADVSLLRHRGNAAAHQADHGIGYREGLEALKVAREMALWFHRQLWRGARLQARPLPAARRSQPEPRFLAAGKLPLCSATWNKPRPPTAPRPN